MYDYIRNLNLNMTVYDPKMRDDFLRVIKQRFLLWRSFGFPNADSALVELMQNWDTTKHTPVWSCIGHPTDLETDTGYLSLFVSLPDYNTTYDQMAIMFQSLEYKKYKFTLDTGDCNLLWLDEMLHHNFSSNFNNALYPTLTFRWEIESDTDAPEIVSLIKKLFEE